MGLILALTAFILILIIGLPSLIYALFRYRSFKAMNDHYKDIAIALDQLGNVIAKYSLNDFLIQKLGEEYGNVDETISSVTGKNYEKQKLTIVGYWLAKGLDKLQSNHVEKAIEEDEQDEIK